MEKRTPGTTDLEIAPIVFGGNVFGWTIDEKTSFAILDRFAESGFNMIDTADTYSRWAEGNEGGESETIIGKWMKDRGNRDQILISTKVGSDMGDGKKGVSKKYIIAAVDDCLTRLQTDYIDLVSTHFDDEGTRVEETMAAYNELVKAGKVKWCGTSNMTAERIQESLDVSEQFDYPLYQTLQPLYNLYDRKQFEREYLELCTDHNLGVFPYFSLASGFLTGKYRTADDLNKSPRGGDMDKHFNDRGFAILDALDNLSEKHEVKQAAIALAWLMAKPTVIAPIASATTVEQMNELTHAATVKLSPEDVSLLDEASLY